MKIRLFGAKIFKRTDTSRWTERQTRRN